MKNKKVSIILLIFGLMLLITGVVSVIIQLQNKSNIYVPEETEYTLDLIDNVSTCYTEICPTISSISLNKINYETDNAELRAGIDKINRESEEYYQMVVESDVSNPSCEMYREELVHDTIVNEYYLIYTKGRYDSVGISRYIYNVCDNIYKYQQVEVYIYDKKEDKVLSQEEFKNALNLSDEEIRAKINEDLLSPNEGLDASVTIDDVDFNDLVLFYDYNGDLYVSYKETKGNTYRMTRLENNNEEE